MNLKEHHELTHEERLALVNKYGSIITIEAEYADE